MSDPLGKPGMMNGRKKVFQKTLDDAELVPFGDPEYGWMRPKSRGRSYDSEFEENVIVDQTARDDCDINHIMKRYEKPGQLADLIKQGFRGETGMSYGDFTDPTTFQEALNISIHAQEQFGMLDAKIRGRFNNDPKEFLQFMADENNKDEWYRLGLAVKPPEKEPEVTLRDLDKTLKEGFSAASKQKKGGKPHDED